MNKFNPQVVCIDYAEQIIAGNCNWTVLFQFAIACCIADARSRSGVTLIGFFALMFASVVNKMHERADQKKQVWQRG